MLFFQKNNIELPSLDYWLKFLEESFPDDEVFKEKCINYIGPLVKNELPVIFDGHHLSKLLGVSGGVLLKMSIAPQSFYRVFEIPKKSGGMRIICTPHKSLKFVQRWILDNILYRIKISTAAKGFVLEKSIVDHLKPHAGNSRNLWITDFKDFFPSINKKRVIGFFRSIGYNNEVSLMLGSLCCVNGSLPQGAPTSPTISNIISRRFDELIIKYCLRKNLLYTRYADDLCISGVNADVDVFHDVGLFIKANGFLENIKKRRFYSSGSLNKLVMGINISKSDIKLTKSFKSDLRKEIFYIDKFGYQDHFFNKGEDERKEVLRLIGVVSYALMIEPDNYSYRVFKYNLMLRSMRYR